MTGPIYKANVSAVQDGRKRTLGREERKRHETKREEKTEEKKKEESLPVHDRQPIATHLDSRCSDDPDGKGKLTRDQPQTKLPQELPNRPWVDQKTKRGLRYKTDRTTLVTPKQPTIV